MTGSAKQSAPPPRKERRASSLSLLGNNERGEGGKMPKTSPAAGIAKGECLCGGVRFEIDVPARWAWHDHSASSRRAHGAAYATYVGSWRKRFRIVKGKTTVKMYEDE